MVFYFYINFIEIFASKAIGLSRRLTYIINIKYLACSRDLISICNSRTRITLARYLMLGVLLQSRTEMDVQKL